jgi:hypothetical protein
MINEQLTGNDAALSPGIGPRMICAKCGIVGADARPNWPER